MRAFKQLGSSFQVYLFASFMGNVALQIFAVYLPLTAYQLGASALEVGLIGGASNMVYSFAPFLVGRFSDTLAARRSLVNVALVILTATSFVYSLSGSPLELLVLRFVEGLGWAMFWPTLDAVMAEDRTRDPRKSLSIFNSVWSAAAAVGPLIGAAIIVLLGYVRSVFLVTAALLFIATAVVGLMPFSSRRTPGADDAVSARPRGRTSAVDGRRHGIGAGEMGYFMAIVAMSAGIRSILFTFFPPLAQSVGISVIVIGSVAFGFGGARFLVFLSMTNDGVRRVILRGSRMRTAALLAFVVMAIGGWLPGLPDASGTLAMLAFILAGFALSTVYTLGQFAMIAGSDPASMGRNAGLFESSVGAGSALGPIVAGFTAGGSLSSPFLLLAPTSLLALPLLVLLLVLVSPRPRAAEPNT